jgi:hypothetical protein
MIPFSNLFNRNKLAIDKTSSNSPAQTSKVSRSHGVVVNQTVNNGIPVSTPQQIELQRRSQLVRLLRKQWLFNNDGISPARMAGLEWGNGEQAWVNQQLEASCENWQA